MAMLAGSRGGRMPGHRHDQMYRPSPEAAPGTAGERRAGRMAYGP